MRLRTRLLTSAAVVGTLVLPLVPGAPAGAAPPAQLAKAVTWLESQQKADGSFEVAGFAGYETPDAVFALASAAQTGATWSTTQARDAVEDVTTGGDTPKDPLDGIDDWVDSVQGGAGTVAAKAQQAAKVIALVTGPLGLDATDFDPSGDSEAAVDLEAALFAAGEPDGAYADVAIGGQAYVLLAHAALDVEVPDGLVAEIAAAQHPDGGFDYTGLPDGEGFDVDITATVVAGLAAADAEGADEVIDAAVLGLAAAQRWDGEWAGVFDDGNPSSTALVVLMAGAIGAEPTSPCWRNVAEPLLTGVPYPSPIRAITRRAQPDGRIASPSDGFSLNTLATSQSIQAMAGVDGPAFYTGTCTEPVVSANERIARAYYVDLLDRLTEPGGAAYWAAQFDGGMSPALLAKRFTGTAEYGQVVIERMVEELLGRPATAEELEGASPLIKSGFRLELRASLLGFGEYIDAAGDDGDWAEAVYLDAVGRPASDGDVTYVLDLLEAGLTHGDIARRLVFSAEGRSFFVRGTYQQLLRRQPAGADLTYWSGLLKRGVSPERLVTLIIGSAEYKNSTQA